VITSTIEYANQVTTIPTNAYIMVFRDFFIFSSSPVASTNQIPHQVIAITASIHANRIKNLMIAATADSGEPSVTAGKSILPGLTTSIAKIGSTRDKRTTMIAKINFISDDFI
jgi:hypothetical protein